MSYLREVWTHAVAGALEAHAVAVVQMAPGHWTFAPNVPVELRVTACIDGEWLVFDAPLPALLLDARLETAGMTGLEPSTQGQVLEACLGWEPLASNAALPGGFKLCLSDDGRGLRLRAELLLHEDVPIDPLVQRACAGIATVVHWLTAPQQSGVPRARSEDFEAADFDLQQRCRETEWPFTVREPSTLMVPLDVASFQQAAVSLHPQRGVVAAVPLLAEAPSTQVCAMAVARLLLSTTGAVRMVRATAVAPGAPSFEVVFAHLPSAEELAHAFAALSVAWSYAGREAEVLARDERIAELYLDGGASALSSADHNNQQPAT